MPQIWRACRKGAILDVAVDIHPNSPTSGRHVSVKLTADNGHQLWVPPGFAHGFVTLAENMKVFYLVTSYYSPVHDRGLLWNDPALGIDNGWRWKLLRDKVYSGEPLGVLGKD